MNSVKSFIRGLVRFPLPATRVLHFFFFFFFYFFFFLCMLENDGFSCYLRGRTQVSILGTMFKRILDFHLLEFISTVSGE